MTQNSQNWLYLEDYEKEEKDKPQPRLVKTGLKTLDDAILGGFGAGEVIVISGPTKHGKTTFCATLTRNLINQGEKTAWFSFEMPPRQFFLGKHRDLIGRDLIIPRMMKAHDVEWLAQMIVDAKQTLGHGFFFIDHLHYVVNMGAMKNPSLEIGTVVRKLKRVAVENEVTIFLVAHMGKEDKLNPGSLSESDIRDSSFIVQEADATILIHRWFKHPKTKKAYRSNEKTKLIVSNHRRTGAFDTRITMRLSNGYLIEDDTITDGGEIDYTKFKSADDNPF